MASSAENFPPMNPPRWRNAKYLLWAVIFLAIGWVIVSNEIALLVDYRLYHAYRLQLIADRWLLAPHAVCGVYALLAGPLQFSSRLRQRNLRLHRLLGKGYVLAVVFAGLAGIAITWGKPLGPGTQTQAGTWILVTLAAWKAAMNRQIASHQRWMTRSYAVTLTFISTRILSIWPAYWNLSDQANVAVIIGLTLSSLLAADTISEWRELTVKRG